MLPLQGRLVHGRARRVRLVDVLRAERFVGQRPPERESAQGQDGGAARGQLLAAREVDAPSDYVGHELDPVRGRAHGPTAGHDLVGRRGVRREEAAHDRDPEGYRLQPGLQDLERAGGGMDAGRDRLCVVGPAGTALAGHEGQDGQAMSVGRQRAQGGVQLLVGGKAQGGGRPGEDVSALAERPAQQRLLGPDLVGPESRGHGWRRVGQDDAHGPGGADGERDPVGRDASAPHVRGRAIADGEEEGHVAQGGPALGVLRGQAAQGMVVVGQRREGVGADVEMAQQRLVPLERAAIEQPAPGRDRVGDGHRRGPEPPPVEERAHGQPALHAAREAGMRGLQPAQAGRHVRRVERTPRALIHLREVQLVAQLLGLAAGARVRIGIERRDGHAPRVRAAGREHERVESDGGDVLRPRARLGQDRVHDLLGLHDQGERVFIRGAVGRGVEGEVPRLLRAFDEAGAAIVEVRPHRRAAHVDHQDERALPGRFLPRGCLPGHGAGGDAAGPSRRARK